MVPAASDRALRRYALVVHAISIDERRARLAVRHHVAPSERVATVLQTTRDLVCLHAAAVSGEAAAVSDWYGSVQHVPRFPAPLYRELVG